jgi:hypothetical protein
MPFALDPEADISEITGAVNYLMANLTDALTVNQGSGQIYDPNGDIYGYLYKYLFIKYADSFDGSLNFSNTPTNRLYYGVRNDGTNVESTNPADYVWYQATGGFGTTKFLFYQVFGGRQIDFYVGTTSPGYTYVQDGGSAIDLDIITTTLGTTNIQAYIVQPQTSSSPALPSYTTGPTLPTGWSASPPVCPAGSVLWYAFGEYNGNPNEVNGIPPNQTKWTGPIAASVFQDIRSDNWNGSNPPVYGSPGTYGTQGYYISRTTGYIYANGLVARGLLQSGSSPQISGGSMTGSGAIINADGTFAFGNSATNITFPGGGSIYVNGQVIYNGNIINNSATEFAGYSLSSSNATWVYTNFVMSYDGSVTITSGGLLSIATIPYTLNYTRLTIESLGGTIYALDGLNSPGSPTSSYEQSYYYACITYLPAGTYRFGVYANVSAVNPSAPDHAWRVMVFRSYK